MLEIIKVVNGYLEENCYIIHDNKYALIIDPGSESNKIIEKIKQKKLNVLSILITHYHFDHVGALEEIKKEFNIDNVIDYMSDENIKIESFDFSILKNPGHTKDSVSYYFKNNKILFSGDFIFKETIGNYDINMEKEMINSLISFKKLPDDIIIYPGHGYNTSVKHELQNNPFLKEI